MKKKICVIIGHGGNDCGAWNQNTRDNELAYNTDLAKILVEKLGLSQNPHLIISLHCKVATGTEVLYWHTSINGKKLANCLQEEILKALELRNRGIKEKKIGDRGARLLQTTKAPCVILEPFFIDNDCDLVVGKAKKDEYANAIVNGIVKYFE